MKLSEKLAGLKPYWLLLALSVTVPACSDRQKENQESGRDIAVEAPFTVDYAAVRPILQKRCVICHACYDASCQLNLSSFEGLQRGASKTRVYDGTRVTAAEPSRLFIDAESPSEWRDRGFFPVLNEASNASAESNLTNSLLYRMLQLKQSNPLPVGTDGRLKNEFDFSLTREWSCPKVDEFDDYAEQHPFAGMPFGLPAIAGTELKLIEKWIADGASGNETEPNLTRFENAINRWESFLNRDSRKGQLVGRYIYEHLFLANLHFSEIDSSVYFKLVRSSTSPEKPVIRIASRRPFDNPGTDRVYYRLLAVKSHIVAKTHMPYALNPKQLERFKNLFFESDFKVDELPGYAPEIASNPFLAFRAIPVRTRYRFMLEHAEFTIRGFMKGAVCRGQVALNVIDDHFWVFFTSPDKESTPQFNEFLVEQASNLSLPTESTSTAEPLSIWLEVSRNQRNYLDQKKRFLNTNLFHNAGLNPSYLWDGDGGNRNAALTVFRHFDSASVRQGLLGKTPKTAWLIDYPILERIHYLLVAGFDVYGNFAHQLLTRMYMDFLRMESEFNFLTLLPAASRGEIVDHWYRDADEDVKDYIYGEHASIDREPDISYQSDNHLRELHDLLNNYLQPILDDSSELLTNRARLEDYRRLQQLQDIEGMTASLMPEMSVVMIDAEESALFTILRNSAHSNISGLFDEKSRRLPDEDSLTILPGIVGAYPDAYWRLKPTQLPSFLQAVKSLQKEQDYHDLMQKFGIRRSNPDFWSYSDRVHHLFQKDYPLQYGLLDYNRLENR